MSMKLPGLLLNTILLVLLFVVVGTAVTTSSSANGGFWAQAAKNNKKAMVRNIEIRFIMGLLPPVQLKESKRVPGFDHTQPQG